jgi:hypothetical protein
MCRRRSTQTVTQASLEHVHMHTSSYAYAHCHNHQNPCSPWNARQWRYDVSAQHDGLLSSCGWRAALGVQQHNCDAHPWEVRMCTRYVGPIDPVALQGERDKTTINILDACQTVSTACRAPVGLYVVELHGHNSSATAVHSDVKMAQCSVRVVQTRTHTICTCDDSLHLSFEGMQTANCISALHVKRLCSGGGPRTAGAHDRW